MLPKEKLHFYFISLCYRLGNYLLTGRFFRKVKPRRKVLGEIVNVGIPFLFMVSHLRILSCSWYPIWEFFHVWVPFLVFSWNWALQSHYKILYAHVWEVFLRLGSCKELMVQKGLKAFRGFSSITDVCYVWLGAVGLHCVAVCFLGGEILFVRLFFSEQVVF